MLQEIAPKRFKNTYENRIPSPCSEIVCVCEQQFLIVHENGSERYPYYHEIEKSIGEQKLTYLFAIEDEVRTDYFLLTPEEKSRIETLPESSWEDNRYMMRRMQPRYEAFVGMTAQHLQQWYAQNRFCGCCGQPMEHDGKERMMRCKACNNRVYPKLAPAVVVAVRNKDKLLVTKYVGGLNRFYALVAGFVEVGETLEEAAAREVMEETGLKIRDIKYFGSQPWGFVGNLMIGYTAWLDGEDDTIHRDEQELAVATWLRADEIPKTEDYNSLTRHMIRQFCEGKL